MPEAGILYEIANRANWPSFCGVSCSGGLGGLGGWSTAFGEAPVDPPPLPHAPQDQPSTDSEEKAAAMSTTPKRKRLVILGTGWAG